MNALKNKLAPDFSEGVDRKLLKQVRDRFMRVNTDRLEKTYEGLSHKQQDMLRVIPLLYQLNHPLMPGYISREVPYGVSGYVPDKLCLTLAKSFSQAFRFQADKRHKAQIHALYMMGSTGTLAHSEQSDVDLWLCHAPELDKNARQMLADKAARIDEWANKGGLELHTFLMDAEQFRSGGLSSHVDKESSGSAQHYLLLDEFYRTAILLAGRYPLWWLIPPDLELDYEKLTHLLLSRRFIKDTEVIDFGSAALIPKNELVGAALWQLYKGIDSPYKSVLKILLAEVYAQEMPAKQSLSQTFKQAVYDDELQVEDLDPYLLVYRRLEQYLVAKNELKRLDLVRKSFYLKVAKRLTRPPVGRVASWQRQAMEKIVSEWQWPEFKLRVLDNRFNWKVEQVLQERQAVVAELSYCYRFLAQYARGQGLESAITDNDMNLLGRKLYSVFQKKAGKVEFINPGITQSLWEENLAIHHSSSQAYWGGNAEWLLYRDIGTSSDASFESTIRKSSQLIELIAWLYFNQILTSATRLSLVPGDTDVSLLELQNMLRALNQTIPVPLPAVGQDTYRKKLTVSSLVLFINVGVDPLKKMNERGMHRISDRTDSLDYSSERHNLVKTIDQIAVNTWNEVMAHRYEMGDTLMQSLQAYLHICLDQSHARECRLHVFCFCPQRAQAIASRVENLFSEARQAFFKDAVVREARYVIEVEHGYVVFQYAEQQFRYFICDSEDALKYRLAQRPAAFSPIMLDSMAQLPGFRLAGLLALNIANHIQVFYNPRGYMYHILVLDEYGSMLDIEVPDMSEAVLQSSLARCLQSLMTNRQMAESIGDALSIRGTDIYRVGQAEATSRAPDSLALKPLKQIQDIASYELHIIAFKEGEQFETDISVSGPHIGLKEFSFRDYAEQQYDALVHFVCHQPGFDVRLPFQLVDVTLSDANTNLLFGQESGVATLDIFKVYARAQQMLVRALKKQSFR